MFEDSAGCFHMFTTSLNRPKSLDSKVEFSCLFFKGGNAGWFQQSLHYSDLDVEQFSHIPWLSVMYEYPCILPTLTLSARVWKGKHHLGMCHLQDMVDPPVCTYV